MQIVFERNDPGEYPHCMGGRESAVATIIKLAEEKFVPQKIAPALEIFDFKIFTGV